ncbi:MAG: GntR family transcriptional regulator [Trebonia sp.]
MTVNPPRRTPAAKRDQVRRQLLDLIEQADSGTVLPPERDLAVRFAVSRPTVRAAIEDLMRAGLVVREHGRGTFTSPHKISQELVGSPVAGLGVPPAEGDWTSRVLEFGSRPAGRARARHLGIEPDEAVLRVMRLRLVGDEPIAIERIDLPDCLVPGLSRSDMEVGNFYHLLRERYGIVVADAVQTMEPTVTNPAEAEQLDVPVYAPALLVERTTRDIDGRIVEFTHSIYRGDRYRITSRLRFDSTSG